MKKILFFLIVILITYLSGITLIHNTNDVETVASGIDTTNTLTWKARIDSIAANLHNAHQVRGAIHVKSDATTAIASILDCSSIPKLIRSLNNCRTQLISHLAQDSVHVGPCTTTTIPDALSESADFGSAVSYAADILTAYDAHYAHTYNTRYRLIAKSADAVILAHAARDTSDTTNVHFFPDTVYTTAAVDTTNADSTRASLKRIANRWNLHAKNTHWHNSSANDTITAAYINTTTLYGDQKLANEIKRVVNNHVAIDRHTIGYPAGSAVHWEADKNFIITADVVHGGHLVADTAGSSKSQAYQEYLMPFYTSNIIQVTASSVTSGATLYFYGSIDGLSYSKVDTLNVTANGTQLHPITTWYPYFKTTIPSRTDGTYTIKFITGGK
ncbi:MAG TPA: hypothetical protein PLM72_07385 [Spirochaetota bacterium]|nr:hypothetical protein [Spirochaetota bacterium]